MVNIVYMYLCLSVSWLFVQTCYCEGNGEKFQTTENMAKRVLPHHEADIDTIVAEYLQKWEEREDNTDLTDEKWEEAIDDIVLTDEERETNDNDAALTGENIVQGSQLPLPSSETSLQSLDEGNQTTSTQN